MYYEVEWKICINFKIQCGSSKSFHTCGFSHTLAPPQTIRDVNLQATFIRDTLVGKLRDAFNLYKLYLNLIYL